jgi:hypothetical protein
MRRRALGWLAGLLAFAFMLPAGAANDAAGLAADVAPIEVPAITRTTIVPSPTPTPAFDHSKIDRTLVEPAYVSQKPAYRFFAFGPEGKSLLSMALDESQGTGKGYDVVYVDLDLDGKLTSAGEKFACPKPAVATKSVAPRPLECGGEAGATCPLPAAGSAVAGANTWIINPLAAVPAPPADPKPLTWQLPVADPVLTYELTWVGGEWVVHTRVKDGGWHARLRMVGAGNVWSQDKSTAPVYRFGGGEWAFHHDVLHGRTFKPGDSLAIDAVRPFFAGSSPEVPFQNASCWVPGGYSHARYSLESLERPGDANRIFLAGNTCCGGTHVDRILIPADFPSGRAEVVCSMDTPDSYLGRVEQRIPVQIENPAFGQPVAELPQTAALRAEFPGDTVVELFQGADLSAWGMAPYDGTRDIYITGDATTGRPEGATSQGATLSYSHDCRNDLRLGTVRNVRTLIRFDLAPLPPETVVKKAVLQFYAAELKPKVDKTTAVFPLRKRWHDTMANGRVAFGDHAADPFGYWFHQRPLPVGAEVVWERPFAKGPTDRVPEPIGTIAFAEQGWDGLDVTATVRQWVRGELENHGVVLELTNPQQPDYASDVGIVSADHPSFPDRRPRLVLVLEKGFRPAAATPVEERDPDLEQARARARAENKLLVCNVLSGKSVTCRGFQKMLQQPDVDAFLTQRFVEIRLDADKPEHRKVLDFYGVKHLPTAIVIRPGESPAEDVFERFEPVAWNTRFGWCLGMLEAPETYTLTLEFIRTKGAATMPWRRRADGELYRLDSHLFYQRFDGVGGIILNAGR